ncbi:hypothetical protein JCM8547_007431 [Rhodosporidiobolus lusitaniae]
MTFHPFFLSVSARGAHGYYLFRFAVVSRMTIAWFWFSINIYQGGTGVKLCLIAIWPSFRNFKKHLPELSGVTSQEMLCFFLFWLFQFPFTLLHPPRLRPLFLIKAISLPIAAVGMMGWTIHQAGDRASEVMRESPKIHGLDAWCKPPSSIFLGCVADSPSYTRFRDCRDGGHGHLV